MNTMIDHISLDDIEKQTFANEGVHPDRSVPMFSLRFKNGSRSAFAYSFLSRVDYNGTDQITLYLMNDIVTIRGNQMDMLVNELCNQTIHEIEEQDELHFEGASVSCIETTPRQSDL